MSYTIEIRFSPSAAPRPSPTGCRRRGKEVVILVVSQEAGKAWAHLMHPPTTGAGRALAPAAACATLVQGREYTCDSRVRASAWSAREADCVGVHLCMVGRALERRPNVSRQRGERGARASHGARARARMAGASVRAARGSCRYAAFVGEDHYLATAASAAGPWSVHDAHSPAVSTPSSTYNENPVVTAADNGCDGS